LQLLLKHLFQYIAGSDNRIFMYTFFFFDNQRQYLSYSPEKFSMKAYQPAGVTGDKISADSKKVKTKTDAQNVFH